MLLKTLHVVLRSGARSMAPQTSAIAQRHNQMAKLRRTAETEQSPPDAHLHRRAARATIWQLVIAVIGTALVVVPATYLFLTSYLNRTITQRIEPYEHLLYGGRLAESGMYDEAAAEFESGF